MSVYVVPKIVCLSVLMLWTTFNIHPGLAATIPLGLVLYVVVPSEKGITAVFLLGEAGDNPEMVTSAI
jgi:hypothetical protein